MSRLAVDERTELLRLEADMAAVRVEVALLRLQLAWKRYDPDQPRVPAGSSDGGQWTDGDGGLGDDPWGARWLDREPELRPVPINDRGPVDPYAVDLDEEENKRNGHTLRDHLNKTDAELLRGVRPPRFGARPVAVGRKRWGTFYSKEEANRLINETLRQNRDLVDEVISGKRGGALLKSRFGDLTGREAWWPPNLPNSVMRPTYGVGVLIRRDRRSPRGYTVHTAYPRNTDEDYEVRMNDAPKEFFKALGNYYQGLGEHGENHDEVMDFLLHDLSGLERDRLREFLERIIRPEVPERELEALWHSTAADHYPVGPGQTRLFLRLLAERAGRPAEGTSEQAQ